MINGFLAAPLLLIIMLIANDPDVMGKWMNGRWVKVLGGITTAVMMLAAAIGLLMT